MREFHVRHLPSIVLSRKYSLARGQVEHGVLDQLKCHSTEADTKNTEIDLVHTHAVAVWA